MKKNKTLFLSFIIFFVVLIILFFRGDWELRYKGDCELHMGNFYQDYVVCKGKVIVDGGYLYHLYTGTELLVVYMKVIYDYPRVCYTSDRRVYVYNYKRAVGVDLSEEDFNKRYDIVLEPKPEKYLKNYANNC